MINKGQLLNSVVLNAAFLSKSENNVVLGSITTPQTIAAGALSVTGTSTLMGNVGIGVTPAVGLHVKKDGTLYGAHFMYNTIIDGNTANKGLLLGYHNDEVMGAMGSDFATSGLAFWTHDGSTFGERMRIRTNGNVGIGTKIPKSTLQLGEAIESTASNGELTLAKSGAGGSNRKFRIGLNSTYCLSIGDYGHASSDVYVEHMTIDYSTGNVGIGTTAGLAKLSINGGLHVGGDTDPGDNNLTVDGTSTLAGTVTTNGNCEIQGITYLRGNILLVNKAVNGWLNFATRNVTGTEAVYILTNISSLSMSGQLTSTVAIGTTPFVVTSTTKVTNLNADKLDDLESTAFATSAQGTKADAALPSASYTAADVLIKIKTVDGAGSGLDADLLDGLSAAAFATAAQGTLAANALPITGGTMTGTLVMTRGTFGHFYIEHNATEDSLDFIYSP